MEELDENDNEVSIYVSKIQNLRLTDLGTIVPELWHYFQEMSHYTLQSTETSSQRGQEECC